MKAFVALTLAVFSGCHAYPLLQDQPMPNKDMLKNAFWDYVAKATFTTKDALLKIRQSDLGQEFNVRITENTRAIDQNVAAHGQVTLLTQNLLVKISQETVQLKAHVEKDLSFMKGQLEPYTKELRLDLHQQVEIMKRDVKPYTEALDSKAVKDAMLQKAEELRGSLEKSLTELQSQLGPRIEEMKQKVDQHLQDFQKNITTWAHNLQKQLTQDAQQKLAPYTEELKGKLDPLGHDLMTQLSTLWDSFIKQHQKEQGVKSD